MIDASRFLIRSTEYEGWLEARRNGVSATAVASAATPAGFRDTVTNWGQSVDVNDYMRFGSESESELMRFAHQEHGILPSDWLLCGDNPRHLATPDGLSLDHTTIAVEDVACPRDQDTAFEPRPHPQCTQHWQPCGLRQCRAAGARRGAHERDGASTKHPSDV